MLPYNVWSMPQNLSGRPMALTLSHPLTEIERDGNETVVPVFDSIVYTHPPTMMVHTTTTNSSDQDTMH